VPDRVSVEQQLARGGNEAVEGPQERGLAGPVRTDHHVDPPGLDRELLDADQLDAAHGDAEVVGLEYGSGGAHAVRTPLCWITVIR